MRSQEAGQRREEARIARGERDALQGSVRASEAEEERRRKAADVQSAELVETRSRIAELEVRGLLEIVTTTWTDLDFRSSRVGVRGACIRSRRR